MSIAIMRVTTSVAIMQGFLGSITIILVVFSATLMLVDLFVAITQVTVSVAIRQLEVSAALIQVKVSTANMCVTIFIVIMQMGVCCNYAGGIFCCELCT